MSYPVPRRTITFVVRLWAEYLEQTPPAWCGEIEHVESGEVARFGDVGKMVEFIESFPKSDEGSRVQ